MIPIPGPSAAIAALSVSGLPTDRFLFVGFLPPKTGARRKVLADVAAHTATLVVYEAPSRVVASLDDMVEMLGDREAFLFREATKLHEEYLRAPLTEIRERLVSRGAVKGEIVLVVSGAANLPAPTEESPEALYLRLTAAGRTRREAVKEVAHTLGLPARDVYRRVLAGIPPKDAENEG